MTWSSRGGDVIHWWENDQAEVAACGSAGRTALLFFAYTVTCGPCIRAVQVIPSDLSDVEAVEAWLRS